MIKSVLAARRNGELIATVAQLWIRPTDLVVDVTYGRGKFWTVYRPENLVAHDLYTVDGVDFRELPEADGSVDVVVFDPPYTSPGGRKTSTVPDFNSRYGLVDVPATPEATKALIADGIDEAARVLRVGGRLLVKTMDYVSSGQLVLGRHHVVTTALACGLRQVDEFVHFSGTGPQPTKNRDGSPRRQVHSRRAHSFLCVFEAPARRLEG